MAQGLTERRNAIFGRGAELFYDPPIQLERGQGAYLFDSEGNSYVDLYNNVPCVGHGNPVVAEAMATQQGRLNVHNRYLHETAIQFGERLCATHPDALDAVVFSCTGTEANEVALRIAREVTGHQGVVCTNAAYHGSSGLVDQLTYIEAGQVTPHGVASFPFPDLFHPASPELDEKAVARHSLAQAAASISDLKRAGHGFAGLIICPILANEGLPRIPSGLMADLAALAHTEGGLFIADEVQSGYGRTGSWWAYQHEQLVPDIVVSGKPMGNGYPLAATVARRDHIEQFRKATGYFNTFAATPVQAAVGMAVMDELEQRDLFTGAAETGTWLTEALDALGRDHPDVGDVRGRGLVISMEMVEGGTRIPNPDAARWLANAMRDAGFLLSNAGTHGHVVKIRPPLVFGEPEARMTVLALQDCLSRLPETPG